MSHNLALTQNYIENQSVNDDDRTNKIRDVFACNTGLPIPWDAWQEAQKRKQTLREQTNRIVELYKEVDINLEKDSNISLIGDVTGQHMQLQAFRNTVFLPTIAQRNRIPYLNNVTYYLENNRHAQKFARYAVITSGHRCSIDELQGRLRWFHRKLSKLIFELRSKYNIEVLVRVTEITVTEEEDGNWSFHPHANVLYVPPFLGEKWEKDVLPFIHGFMGTHWMDCGRIREIREVIKYCFKPDDILQFLEACPDLRANLFDALFNQRMIECHGNFKLFKKGLDDEKFKCIRVRYKRDGQTISRMEKVPKFPKGAAPEKDATGGVDNATENYVIGRVMPYAVFTQYAEPCSLVMNYNPDPQTDKGIENLECILKPRHSEALEHWVMNGAPEPGVAVTLSDADDLGNVLTFPAKAQKSADPYRVHTCSISVPQNQPDEIRTRMEDYSQINWKSKFAEKNPFSMISDRMKQKCSRMMYNFALPDHMRNTISISLIAESLNFEFKIYDIAQVYLDIFAHQEGNGYLFRNDLSGKCTISVIDLPDTDKLRNTCIDRATRDIEKLWKFNVLDCCKDGDQLIYKLRE